MRELRLHSDTPAASDRRADTIPFPGGTAGASRLPPRRTSFDAVQMAERALENVERHVDELTGLVDAIRVDPELFSWDDDDGPSAA